MKNRWTLYCHTHIATGRRYIGLTKYTMMHRWNQHCAQALRSKDGRWRFPNAIRKYGKDAFAHEVLAQSWTLEGANATEEELILQYDTRNPEKGFNLAKGGDHKPHGIRKNPWLRPEYREKQEASSKRKRNPSPQWIARQSQIARTVASRPEVKAKLEAASQALHRRPGFIQSKSDRWKDLEYASKCSIGLKIGVERMASRTHCNHGHALVPENVWITKRGRKCKKCHWIRERKRKEAACQ